MTVQLPTGRLIKVEKNLHVVLIASSVHSQHSSRMEIVAELRRELPYELRSYTPMKMVTVRNLWKRRCKRVEAYEIITNTDYTLTFKAYTSDDEGFWSFSLTEGRVPCFECSEETECSDKYHLEIYDGENTHVGRGVENKISICRHHNKVYLRVRRANDMCAMCHHCDVVFLKIHYQSCVEGGAQIEIPLRLLNEPKLK